MPYEEPPFVFCEQIYLQYTILKFRRFVKVWEKKITGESHSRYLLIIGILRKNHTVATDKA